jgi:hypothetical protein
MRSNVTKSSVNVALGTNRSFARTRIAKSLCAFVLRQRDGAIAPLSHGECAGEVRDGYAMPPRHMRPHRVPAIAGGWYRSGRLVDLGRHVSVWQRSVN